jgi:hypothetical protein
MVDGAVRGAHPYSAYLRLYVEWTPEHGESAWQQAQQFEQLSQEQKMPGHWYRYEGEDGLIEVQADRSGEWHGDGKLPEGVDAASVVVIPRGRAVPGLQDRLVAMLEGLPKEAPSDTANRAEIEEMIAMVRDLPSATRAQRLVKNFQKTLASVPAVAEEQVRFLRQASQQMVMKDLLAGRVRGYDVAGVLLIAAIAEAVAATDAQMCVAMMTKAAGLEVRELAESGARVIDDCWWRGMPEKVTAALDSLRSTGEGMIRSAQEGRYPEGHPEMLLDIYYASLLQAVPYMLAAEEGYHKLMMAPKLSQEDKERFAHKAETAEEKLVRLDEALLYATLDVDLSRLRGKQAEIRALVKTDREKAEALAFETINLQFFYPLNFKSVLMGDGTAAA